MAKQTFVASTVLTAAQMNALQANDYNQTVSTKTASYTLVAADVGTRIVMNSATATTITVNTSLFSAGDTLFLQNISTGVCTLTAGSATVSSAGPLAIPQNGGGLLYFISAGVSIYYPTTVTPRVGQIVNTVKTDTFTSTSTTYVDITGLSLSITPTSTSSTILIFAVVNGSGASAVSDMVVQLLRNSTAIGNGAAAGSRRVGYAQINASTGSIYGSAVTFLDSPATTSATTYKIQGALMTGAGTFTVNRSPTDTDNAAYGRVSSQITAIEVLP